MPRPSRNVIYAIHFSWLVLICALAFSPTSLNAQTHTVSFYTDEGTWLSIDVAPSGESLVFELLTVETGEGERIVENTNGPSAPLVSSPAPGPYSAAQAHDGSVYFTSVTPRPYAFTLDEVWPNPRTRTIPWKLRRNVDRTATITAIEKRVRETMEQSRIPGVAVAVVSKGDVLLSRGFGTANIERALPVTNETMFQTGSVGKQFTAVGIMALCE